MHNKAMQSDSANCHALCVPHKGAPACYEVDCGVMQDFIYFQEFEL